MQEFLLISHFSRQSFSGLLGQLSAFGLRHALGVAVAAAIFAAGGEHCGQSDRGP